MPVVGLCLPANHQGSSGPGVSKNIPPCHVVERRPGEAWTHEASFPSGISV